MSRGLTASPRPPPPTHALFGLALLCGAGCCKSSALNGAQPALAVSPGALAFTVYLGAQGTQQIELSNSGLAGDDVAESLDGGGPFLFAGPPSIPVAGGAVVPLSVTFAPSVAGTFTAALQLRGSAGALDVLLTGTALAPVACAATGPCDQVDFDADAGACTHAVAPNGTACSDPSLCLQTPQCQSGACVGDLKSCDDHDACTRDYCVSGQGCQHDDTSGACQGSQACHQYGCDPASGCTDAQAPNGTPCSLNESCQTAEVCLFGSCVGTPVPDGFPCKLWWEPCVDAGCHQGQCSDPVADSEVPGQLRWDAGLLGAFGPHAVDDAGTSFFTGFAQTDAGYTQGLFAFDTCGKPLWENQTAPFEGLLLDSDQAIGWTSSQLIGLNPQSGAPLWTLDLGVTLGGCGDGGCAVGAGPGLAAIAQSNLGLLYLIVVPAGAVPDGGLSTPALVGAYRDGQVAWVTALPQASGWIVVADAKGNADVGGVSGDLVGEPFAMAFDPTGQPLFQASLSAVRSLSAGLDFLFVGGANTALALDGGVRYQASNAAGWLSAGTGAVIAGTGSVITSGSWDGGSGLVSLSPGGTPRWQQPFSPSGSGIDALSSPVLGADGTIYAAIWGGVACFENNGGLQGDPPGVTAFDGDSGAVLWSTQLAGSAVCVRPRLALTPGASLLFSGENILYSVFAGQNRPPTDAPWPRSLGGDNSNRSSVPQGL